jgi:hypothetical protein
MMRDLNELRRKRGSIVAQMRALTDAAEAEYEAGKRTSNALTAEEDAKYGAMDHDQEELRKEIEREERLLALEKERETADPTPIPKPEEERSKPKRPREGQEYESAYRSYLASALRNVTPQELRALQADSDTTGGYIVTFNDLSGAVVTGAAGGSDKFFVLDVFRPLDRYVRTTLTRAVANSIYGGTIAIQYGAHKRPTAHDAATLAAAAILGISPSETYLSFGCRLAPANGASLQGNKVFRAPSIQSLW